MNGDIEGLRWVRAFSPQLIPMYLVEQIKDREYSVENFYKYHDINCTIEGKNGPSLNPFNHLYVLANDENLVKGFLWFVVDPLTRDMIINTYSVDEAYWNKGKAVGKLANHVKKLMKQMDIKKAFWMTNYPKHSERNGFKRSKFVLMEYSQEEKNGQDGGKHSDGVYGAQEEYQHIDTGATAASEPAISAAGT